MSQLSNCAECYFSKYCFGHYSECVLLRIIMLCFYAYIVMLNIVMLVFLAV